MFKLYRKFYDAQISWIREHPVQYVALNVVLTAGFLGYMEYQDRQWMREFENENPPID
jgi:hypothetical protein